jgi:hypothetical protein
MPRAGVSVPAETIRAGEAWEDERVAPPRNGTGVPGRRTVTIQGRGAERNLPPPRSARRGSARPHERAGFKPDRAAKWAVLLGVLLVLVAATSSRGATPSHPHSAPPATALHAVR